MYRYNTLVCRSVCTIVLFVLHSHDNYFNFCIHLEFEDFNFTSDSIPVFELIVVGDVLQLSPIHFPIGFAFNDSLLEAPETFTVLITEYYYELDPARQFTSVTILDTTCKYVHIHIESPLYSIFFIVYSCTLRGCLSLLCAILYI